MVETLSIPCIFTLENSIFIIAFFMSIVWIYNFGKNYFGHNTLALAFTILVVFLILIPYPDTVWILIIIFIMNTFGKEILETLMKK